MLSGLDLAQLAPRISCMVRLLLLLLIFWSSFANPGSCQEPTQNQKPNQNQNQNQKVVNDYRRRLWVLFHRLDRDGDGKLQLDDLRKYPRLRSLDRNGDGQVLIKDLPSLKDGPLGERIQNAFRFADRDGDNQLNAEEAKSLPGISSRFKMFDKNLNGKISIQELLWLHHSLGPGR
ncbi:MAG: hypothetical protein EBX47_08500 [Synechococcaceae bacterium WB8_1B_057]|nr:hypothetical protein [Synechococcaceae bacterium WB8_1B_057]